MLENSVKFFVSYFFSTNYLYNRSAINQTHNARVTREKINKNYEKKKKKIRHRNSRDSVRKYTDNRLLRYYNYIHRIPSTKTIFIYFFLQAPSFFGSAPSSRRHRWTFLYTILSFRNISPFRYFFHFSRRSSRVPDSRGTQLLYSRRFSIFSVATLPVTFKTTHKR